VANAAREFQVFVKPAGALCNLECRYCYYLETASLDPAGAPLRMTEDVLDRYIAQHLAAAPGPQVAFSWHGGEPTVLGLDYFRRIVELQRKHRPPGWHIVNGMQTNGLLLDDAWCRFLAAEGFRVGLSLDGPQELHDAYRVTRGGEPTHLRVMRAFERLVRHQVATDILTVVHDRNVRHPLRVYRYLRGIGAESVSFLPLVERVRGAGGGVTSRTVPADAYGVFLCDVFDEWLARDRGRISVQLFDEATRPALGLEHSLCIFRPTCGDVPVIEHNGDFYSCDHFVDAAHRLGNIATTTLGELIESEAQRAFGDAKRDGLPGYCRTCEFLAMCNGGCPKDRFIATPDGEPGLNYLCVGFKRFFARIQPFAAALSAGRPAKLTLDQVLRVQEAADTVNRNLAGSAARARPAAGRNDPCPCGSGRKYKHCCGR